MCKQIKRLAQLSECMHLSKTDRDACAWAVQQISPPIVEPEKGFNGFDFSSWPELPSKSTFNDYDRVRKKKHGTLMTQAWVDTVSSHLNQLAGVSISVNQALILATASGWRVIKFDWVKDQLQPELDSDGAEEITINNAMPKIMSGAITSITQVPSNVRKELESLVRIGRIKKPGSLDALAKIGFAL